TVMELGDSDDLTIGEWVMTLGSPFGLEQSVATGIVSATSRSQIMDAQESMQSGGTGETTIYPNMIQTDAAINPGNSGGALVDSDGKLIGINTLITSYSGNYSGVGFAIPVNYAVNLANQIIAGENPTHAQLGVSLSSVNDQTASAYGLPTDEGAYVAAVSEGSGAAAAGIQAGDIITAFDGEKVESASDLMLAVRGKQPGDTVKLTVNTDGKEREVEVTLGDDSATQQEQQTPENDQRGNGDNQSTPDNGDQRGNEGWGQDDRGNGNGYGYGDGYGNGGNDYGYGWGGGNGYGYGNGGSLEDLFGQR
ncbi:MAG: PDZ domain-containing protein, partial [Adlercreutzia sp.]|nr:PDZ domain-containing protein [Adlercreutzia sp.]